MSPMTFCVAFSSILVTQASGSLATDRPVTCGVEALYQLMRLEGRHLTYDDLAAILPLPPAGGYSMKQLRDAAAQRGLRLSGVRLSGDIGKLETPALLHLQRQKHGHFVVILPVGHSRKLVQILDGERPPVVVDAADVSQTPGWTGLALVPDRPNGPAWAAGGVALASGLALVGMLVRRRRRQPRTADSAP